VLSNEKQHTHTDTPTPALTKNRGAMSEGSADTASIGQDDIRAEYQWSSYSIMDSSRVSTCLISMLLIVYGSFRSLNMEQEARERAEREKKQNESMTNLLTGEPVHQEQSKPTQCRSNDFIHFNVLRRYICR
jgi:hypothetical protein